VLESLGPRDVQRAAESWKADTAFLMAAPEASMAESVG